MKPLRYLPDIFTSVVAITLGLVLAIYFHTKWYYGGCDGWMSLFGDPPSANPAYQRFVPLFISAPYIAAGFGAGILAGFGRPQTARILIRSASLLVLFLFLASRNSHLAMSVFIPVATGAFFLSTLLSLTYFWLLTRIEYP